MLKSNTSRVIAYFTAEYQPDAALVGKLPSAAEVIRSEINSVHWGVSSGAGFVLREPTKRLLVVVDINRVWWQMLGLDVWQENLSAFATKISETLGVLGVKRLRRISFKTTAFLPLQMSHAEMTTLFFGGFLAPSVELEGICGKPDDCLLQLHGHRAGMKLTLLLAPQTPDQAGGAVMAVQNLAQFLEPQMLDQGVKEFRDRVAQECLLVDVDLFRLDLAVGEVPSFIRSSLDEADKITDAAVSKLKSLRSKRGF